MFSQQDVPSSGESRAHSQHHRFHLSGRVGTVHFDFSAELHAPWSVLFGASGSGKSTLLRALCGLHPTGKPHTTLQLTFTRRDAADRWTPLTTADVTVPAHQRGIAYAPQSPSLFPHLSVCENVRFGAESQAASSTLAEEARELFELAALWDHPPAQLSGGEQQRVNLARAFARPNSRLLLLDEPFAGMDRGLRDRLLGRLRSTLARRGLPVLSVTHDVEEAFLLGADVLRLENGRLADQGPATHVLASEALQIRAAIDAQTQGPHESSNKAG